MDIEKLKRFKSTTITIYGLLTLVGILLGVLGIVIQFYYLAIGFFLALIFLILFIVSFGINYKEYKVEGATIFCYAGWEKHYLIVNGELVDEHITALTFTPIELKYKDDFHEYNLTVSISNNFTLKVDGKLVK